MDASNKIDYIEMATSNIPKTQVFFGYLLRWSFQDFGPDYIAFNDGRMAGGFYKSKTIAALSEGSVLVLFYISMLKDFLNRSLELDGFIVKDIFLFPGGRRFHFKEPGGSEYAILSDK